MSSSRGADEPERISLTSENCSGQGSPLQTELQLVVREKASYIDEGEGVQSRRDSLLVQQGTGNTREGTRIPKTWVLDTEVARTYPRICRTLLVSLTHPCKNPCWALCFSCPDWCKNIWGGSARTFHLALCLSPIDCTRGETCMCHPSAPCTAADISS